MSQAGDALEASATRVRALLAAGDISDEKARSLLAEALYRHRVIDIEMRRYGVPEDIWPEVRGRALVTVAVKIMNSEDFRAGDESSFAAFAFHAARFAVMSAVRDERRQSGRFPLADDIPDVEDVQTPAPGSEGVLDRLDALSYNRMRGPRKTHVGALAVRVALGLPEMVRPADASARTRILGMLSEDPSLAHRVVKALAEGEDTDPLLALPWVFYDEDALRIVHRLDARVAHELARSAVEDYPRPPVRPMRRLIANVVSMSEDPAWKELAPALVEAFVMTECDSMRSDPAELDELLARALAAPGAPIGTSPVVALRKLRETLISYVPVPKRQDIEQTKKDTE